MPFDPGLLRAHRARKNLTQEQLAALSGVSKGTIVNLEKDGADGKLSSIERIAKALGADEREFFSPSCLVS